MFTGLVAGTGEVVSIAEGAKTRRIVLCTAFPLDHVSIGASVACDGCCLTVVEKKGDMLSFDAGAETLALTTLGGWKAGTLVNLETSLRLGDELGGHMMSGHVDGLAVVEDVKPDGESWRLKLGAPDRLAAFIAPKGSVALNGISLTVNEADGPVFGVCIIPHTWKVTNIHRWKVGDKINFEADMLARYVARALGREAA
jgi:riboflavin synthase